jgi:hypothetical protein
VLQGASVSDASDDQIPFFVLKSFGVGCIEVQKTTEWQAQKELSGSRIAAGIEKNAAEHLLIQSST